MRVPSFCLGDCFDEWSKQHGTAYQTNAFGLSVVSTYVARVSLAHVIFPRSSQPNLNISRSIDLWIKVLNCGTESGFCSRLFLLHNSEILAKVRI
jgi:hypothetical protein